MLQLDMRQIGAADEANGARTGAKVANGCFFGFDDLRSKTHAEISVGVHAKIRAIMVAGEKIARPVSCMCRQDAGNDVLLTLQRSRCRFLGKDHLQVGFESIMGH